MLVQPIFASALVVAMFTTGTPHVHAEPIVIVNPSVAGELDDEQVAKLFLGQSKTIAGSEASPVDQKEGPIREEFGNKVLKKNPAQLKALWARQIFTGGAKPPKELENDDAVVKFVASTPGAIGYVDSATKPAGVKVLKR